MIRIKQLFLIVTLLVSVCAGAQIEKVIPSQSVPPKLVNDFTGSFLTAPQKEALESKLYRYDDSTSNQIAVVIVKSLEGYSVEDFALALGRKWGVGSKDFNNGVVLLVSTGGGAGNRKATIQAGYGLEGVIPDLTAKSIIDNEIIPNFKQENYYRGLDEATDAIIRAAEGRYKAPAGYGNRKKKGISLGTIILILVILTLIFGAGGGAAGGGMMSRRGYRGWWGPTMWTGGGGSGWSGGGGGGSSGGFGGFGGGSFGGGGASGSW